MNEESLFAAALDKPTALERQAFLDEACAGDVYLRQRVEKLLAADGQAPGILDHTKVAPPMLWATSPETPLAANRDFADRFRLGKKLGEGGMGEVWIADQLQPVRRRVALKLIRAGLGSAHLIARFEQERQALALMNHPNIAKVLDAGVESGRPFFVMELIEGVPLTCYCDEARLTIRERLELFLPVCQAVQHAHQKGVLHRDLKPNNILVALCDGKPVPTVIDFGLAKAIGPQLREPNVSTEVGTLLGTLEYMSPEQADLINLDVDTRSDIYSLGVMLYELLTGRVPFSHEELQAVSLAEMLRIIKEVEPPIPSARLSDAKTLPRVATARRTDSRKLLALVRGELDWIVMKCLDKDPARRYETASGLALDLGRYLADEPVQACPPTMGYRFRKFARRHRGALAAALGFVLLLVTAVVTLTIALIAVNRERQEKVAALEMEGKRRKQAREALDAMSSQIIEDWLAKQTTLLPEHKQFLQLALRHYEEFVADTGEDQESQAGVARAYQRVGFIRNELGQRADAEAAWLRSRELYAGLAADFPDVPAYRHELARTLRRLGNLYRYTSRLPQDTSRLPQAEEVLLQSLNVLRPLTVEFPDRPDYKGELAGTLNALGIVFKNTTRPAEAEKMHRQALDVFGQLADQFPEEPVYQDQVAQTYQNLGRMLDALPERSPEIVLQPPGRVPEAEKSYAQAVAIYERLAAKHPKTRRYREQLGITRTSLADRLRDREQDDEAEKMYRQALKTSQQLADEFPSLPEYRRNLAITYNNLGILLRRTKRDKDAVEAYRQSLVIQKQLAADFPEVTDHLNEVGGAMTNLARMLLLGKQPREARKLLEEALPYHQAALKANSHHPGYRNFYRLNRWRLTETLLELKEHAAAATTTEQFLEMAVEPPRDAYTATCLLADCVRLAMQEEHLSEGMRQDLITTYGDSALAAFRLAIEKGAKEVSQKKRDRRLDPLRPRADFQKLVGELEAKRK